MTSKINKAEEIPSLQLNDFIIRQADANDVSTYFEWVNDIAVRRQSFKSETVLWENHQKWFQQKLNDQNCLMLVMEADEYPVGQIRFDIEDGVAHIDYSLDKNMRGRKLGEILVREGLNIASKYRNVIFQAEVKQQNIASIKVFLKLGFSEQKTNDPEIRQFIAKL